MLRLPALALVLFAVASGAGPVAGRLIAAGGSPIVGADVLVVGEQIAGRTNADGRFVWPVAPRLPALVLAVLPDGRVSRPVRLRSLDAASELVLTLDATVSEMVVVNGTAPGIDTAPAAPATLLTAADVDLRHPSTLTRAVDAVPGVSAIGEGRSAVPVIRGLARGRTSIVVDGTRALTERRAGANAAFLDPAVVRTIEVARGPASVAYGSDAFGGIIAVRTRGPDAARGTHVQLSGTAGGGVPAGSWRRGGTDR